MERDIYDRENDWFRANEAELLADARRMREARVNALKDAESKQNLEKLRVAHWLKCPKCGHDMKSISMQGIEIEQCTFCEGIYFDRGELDNLLMKRIPERFHFFRRLFDLD